MGFPQAELPRAAGAVTANDAMSLAQAAYNLASSGGGSSSPSGVSQFASGGRLSVVSNDPVPNTGTGSSLYFLPFTTSYIAIYDGSSFVQRNFGGTGIPLDCSAGKNGAVWDIFAKWNDPDVELVKKNWKEDVLTAVAAAGSSVVISVTDSSIYAVGAEYGIYGAGGNEVFQVEAVGAGTITARVLANSYDPGEAIVGISQRATALTRVNGIWVDSADNTLRYLGTIRFTGNGTINDTEQERCVWNVENRQLRAFSFNPAAASWTYSVSGAFRPANNNFGYRVCAVNGLTEDMIYLTVNHAATADITATTNVMPGAMGVGINQYSSIDSQQVLGSQPTVIETATPSTIYLVVNGMSTLVQRAPTIGFNYYQLVEIVDLFTGTTITFYGNMNGRFRGLLNGFTMA